jgi:succinate-semialdehyde dehydrogenase/glutarate-semialdehyde dehydrogenase
MNAVINLKDVSLLRTQCFVGGQWVSADSGCVVTVTDPADGRLLAAVPDCGAIETQRAIAVADAAWPAWRSKTAKERASLLRRWYELILAAADDLAQLITAEGGKPLSGAKWRTALLLSNGLPKKASAPMAKAFRPPPATSAC